LVPGANVSQVFLKQSEGACDRPDRRQWRHTAIAGFCGQPDAVSPCNAGIGRALADRTPRQRRAARQDLPIRRNGEAGRILGGMGGVLARIAPARP